MKNVALIYAKFRKTIKFETNGSTYTFLAFIDFPTAIDFSSCFFAGFGVAGFGAAGGLAAFTGLTHFGENASSDRTESNSRLPSTAACALN
jgi:hypothetical protein